jgi:hypothetical protein
MREQPLSATPAQTQILNLLEVHTYENRSGKTPESFIGISEVFSQLEKEVNQNKIGSRGDLLASEPTDGAFYNSPSQKG